MKEAILSTLYIMGWLGIILFILASTNIITKTLANTWSKQESFSWKKLFKGITKVLIFYISAVAIGIAFTILPFVNIMITNVFGVILFSNDVLDTLSTVAILSIVVAAVINQGKKAIESVMYLSSISTGEKEEITWNVEEE